MSEDMDTGPSPGVPEDVTRDQPSPTPNQGGVIGDPPVTSNPPGNALSGAPEASNSDPNGHALEAAQGAHGQDPAQPKPSIPQPLGNPSTGQAQFAPNTHLPGQMLGYVPGTFPPHYVGGGPPPTLSTQPTNTFTGGYALPSTDKLCCWRNVFCEHLYQKL